MRKAIIHIGMHKTGTTAIQHALSGYRDSRLAMSGLAPNGHNTPLTVLFADRPSGPLPAPGDDAPANQLDGRRAEFTAMLDKELAETGRSILWSAEMLSFPPHARGMAERMIARLRPHFDRIEVIAYVRAPGPFITAALQERLRNGRAPPGWRPIPDDSPPGKNWQTVSVTAPMTARPFPRAMSCWISVA